MLEGDGDVLALQAVQLLENIDSNETTFNIIQLQGILYPPLNYSKHEIYTPAPVRGRGVNFFIMTSG